MLVESTRLMGMANQFASGRCAESDLFASEPVMGLLVLCLPRDCCSRKTLDDLSRQIDALSSGSSSSGSLSLASSVLPGDRGLFIRAVANSAQPMQRCFKSALGYVRALRNQVPLPYSVR